MLLVFKVTHYPQFATLRLLEIIGRTDIPVLLMSGSDDPVTPPTDAEAARQGLTRSLHVVLNGFGHGQLTAPCVGRILASFMASATVADLDARCIEADRPMPFFTSLGGPAP